jgi:hypothetical protein
MTALRAARRSGSLRRLSARKRATTRAGWRSLANKRRTSRRAWGRKASTWRRVEKQGARNLFFPKRREKGS